MSENITPPNSEIITPSRVEQSVVLEPLSAESFVKSETKNYFYPIIIAIILFATLSVGIFFFIRAKSLTKEVNSLRSSISPSSIPSPTSSTNDPTANWQVITNTSLGYTIKLPTNWKVVEHSSNFNETYESYVSPTSQRVVINKNSVPRLVCRGDCPVVEASGISNIGKYKAEFIEGYLGDIGGDIAHQYITANFPSKSYSLDVTFHPSTSGHKPGNDIVAITEEERNLFAKALFTFKFTDPTPATVGYSCPKTEWVDCMPGPNAGVKLECSSEYLSWAQVNCPGFKGAAL